MDMHTPTTLVLIVMVSAGLAMALGLIARRHTPELALSAASMGLTSLAYLLLALRGSAPELFTVVLANLAASAAPALAAQAVYRFQGRPPPLPRLWTPVLLVTAIALLMREQPVARLPLIVTLTAWQLVLVLVPLWQWRQRTPGPGPCLLGGGVLIMMVVALNRTRPFFSGDWQATPIASVAHLQDYGFASLPVAMLMVAIGMLSMVQRRAEETLSANERQYRSLIESAQEGICVLQEGRVRYANPRVRDLVGYTADEMQGRPFLDFVDPTDRELAQRNYENRLRGQADGLRYPVRLLTRHQGVRWFEVSGVALQWQGGPAALVFLSDITERRREDEYVHELAYHDALTGLANRRLLLDHLELTLAANRRHAHHGALVYLDLDNFKPLNDRHGHHVGDILLVEVARRLRHCVRELDTVARFGGDEFIVLLSGLAPDPDEARRQAQGVAEKARQALSAPYVLHLEGDGGTVEHRCSASLGVLVFDGHGERATTAESLLERADAAMYQAKQDGGNAVRYADSG